MNINPSTSNPLDQLPPIILPEAVSVWPPAPGWWLLAFISIALISTVIILAVSYYQSLALKRAAKKEANLLLAQYRQSGDAQQYLLQCNQLLRRYCLQQFPDIECASISGKQWLIQLDLLTYRLNKQKKAIFNSATGKILLSIYQAPETLSVPINSTNIETLHQLLVEWFKKIDTGSVDGGVAKRQAATDKRARS